MGAALLHRAGRKACASRAGAEKFPTSLVHSEYPAFVNDLLFSAESFGIKFHSTDSLPKYPGLDNLPNEVQFLLDEIRYKETRAQGEFGVFLFATGVSTLCSWRTRVAMLHDTSASVFGSPIFINF